MKFAMFRFAVSFVFLVPIALGKHMSVDRAAQDSVEIKDHLERLLDDGDQHSVISMRSTLVFMPEADQTDVNKLKNYEDGRNYCKNMGGDLVTVQSNRKMKVIQDTSKTGHIWIGAKRSSISDAFKWVTGEPVYPAIRTFSEDNGYLCLMWDDHSPNFFRFDDWSCATKYSIICDIEGWHSHMDMQVKLNTIFIIVKSKGKNFQEAQNKCQELGGDLATPTSFKELDMIDNHIPFMSGGTSLWWLGGKREYLGAPETWITGERIVPKLREWSLDDGGKCLLYDANPDNQIDTNEKGRFDYEECSRTEDIEGYVCQINKQY